MGLVTKIREIDLSEAYGDDWFNTLVKTVDNNEIDGVVYPSFPDEQIQIWTNGSAGEYALLEAYPFYRRILAYSEELGKKIDKDTKILDFGCGWGRHLRYFWKGVDHENLYGTDVDIEYVKRCQSAYPAGNFSQNSMMPPLKYPDNSFDILYAYSVFTHLNETCNLAWMEEFARVLKPGGVVFLTTQGKRFIDFCASFRDQESFDHDWFAMLAKIFDTDESVQEAKLKYERGEFLYFDIGGGGGPRDHASYGEAIVPPEFFRLHWTKKFDVIDFYDPRDGAKQAVVTLRKKA